MRILGKHTWLLLTLALCLTGSTALGQAADTDPLLGEPDTDTQQSQSLGMEPPSLGKAFFRMVMAMVLILALLIGGLALFQKYARRGVKMAGGNRPLRVIDRASLGPKKSVCLVNVCGRYLVLGVSEKEVNMLTEVALPTEEEEKVFSAALANAEARPATAKS